MLQLRSAGVPALGCLRRIQGAWLAGWWLSWLASSDVHARPLWCPSVLPAGEECYYRPPYHNLRHPFIFYYGHVA